MADAVPRGGTIRRVTLQIEGDAGCGDCHGSGEVLSNRLDPEGKWFLHEPCENCNGTGAAPCAAHGCTHTARCVVSIGSSGRAFACCGEHDHAQQLIHRLMDGWL